MLKCVCDYIHLYKIIVPICTQQKYCYMYMYKAFTITLYALMDSSFWFVTINLGWSIVYISRGHRLNSTNKVVFLSLKIVFVLANSVDPDETF